MITRAFWEISFLSIHDRSVNQICRWWQSRNFRKKHAVEVATQNFINLINFIFSGPPKAVLFYRSICEYYRVK
jgi:hypothetical protein